MSPEQIKKLYLKVRAERAIDLPIKQERASSAFRAGSADPANIEEPRSVKRQRAPALLGGDVVGIVEERNLKARVRLSPSAEVIDISD